MYKPINQKFNMALAIIKIKIMPESPDTDLEDIQKQAEKTISGEKGSNIKFEKEPIAFGLNALNIIFSREETLDSDSLINNLKEISGVNSAEITDFRRAIG
ncbi:elongation factor 1-beta [Candidatus Pacearchaeota archaeon]|nr:elongation factor 1-beta [Candidatus Pacearchaeota archaeon]MBD3283112.1 elongation factor 1-beta [Candidatus Pacearchaeota archaeon]